MVTKRYNLSSEIRMVIWFKGIKLLCQ